MTPPVQYAFATLAACLIVVGCIERVPEPMPPAAPIFEPREALRQMTMPLQCEVWVQQWVEYNGKLQYKPRCYHRDVLIRAEDAAL